MYPHDVDFAGLHLSIWNAVFLAGVVAGYPLLLLSFRLHAPARRLRASLLRWVVTVYVSALGAQLFAYLFDLNTSALPPNGFSWLQYYFDPLAGAKTLYGAIVFLPVSAWFVSVPWGDLGYSEALDVWTPPMFGVLAVARLGCFLQGCCYGRRTEWFGVSFPPHSAVQMEQVSQRLIAAGDPSIPVFPAQAAEALVLVGLTAWSLSSIRAGAAGVFLKGIAFYSAFRFAIEFVRDDPDRNFLASVSTSQWIALAVLSSVIVLTLRRRPLPG